jgi:hypothetical protein
VKELVAYFDDSRNEDAGIVVVAGYVASVATWDRFGSAWARALGAGQRVAVEYKTSDCRQAVQAFKDWTRDERDALTRPTHSPPLFVASGASWCKMV